MEASVDYFFIGGSLLISDQMDMCIRQVKAKLQEAQNGANFTGELDDKLMVQIIGSYVKTLEKGIGELAAGGERGADLIAKYRAEMQYLGQFLQQMLDAEATQKIVRETLSSLGITDIKQAGRALGAIMKAHRGTVDAQLAKSAIEAVLGG